MASDGPSKTERLRVLVEEFAAELPHRVKELRQTWSLAASSPQTRFSEEGPLRRLAHNLAGAAGTFGYRELGEEARKLERALIALDGCLASQAAPELLETVGNLIARLEYLSGGTPQIEVIQEERSPQASVLPEAPFPLLYVLEDDDLLAQEMEVQLESFGYRVRCFAAPGALLKAFKVEPPTALLADISFPEGSLEGTRVVEELRATGLGHVPVLFVSAHTEWNAQLAALRAGGRGFLPKPLEYPALLEQLDLLAGKRVEAPLRILVMDDDPLLARHYAQLLESSGMDVQVLKQPEGVLEALSAFAPDLLLTDVYMPGCTGIEVASIIRQNSAYTHLPIVYLSGEHSTEAQLAALRSGGDDFLEKPIRDAHLLAAIDIRARRFRALSSLMQRDSLTGLLNHMNLKLALDREIAQANRRKSVLSVAMIDIDHFKGVNDNHGHPMGDRVIKSLSRLLTQNLRKGDIPARYGGEEFTLVLPDTGPESALKVVDTLRRSFGSLIHRSPKGDFQATFSAGVASIPPHPDAEALLKAADAALYAAKRAGRNQVIWEAAKPHALPG